MKLPAILCVATLALFCGCSCTSTVERANLTSAEEREEYVAAHPDCPFADLIRQGEITHGMCSRDVIASWGMPNVYALSKKVPGERWIYYIRDPEATSVLIYTLIFEDDTLSTWDIDQKRFTGQGIATGPERILTSPVSVDPPSSKRR